MVTPLCALSKTRTYIHRHGLLKLLDPFAIILIPGPGNVTDLVLLNKFAFGLIAKYEAQVEQQVERQIEYERDPPHSKRGLQFFVKVGHSFESDKVTKRKEKDH